MSNLTEIFSQGAFLQFCIAFAKQCESESQQLNPNDFLDLTNYDEDFEEASISSITQAFGDISYVVKTNPSLSLNCIGHQYNGGGEGGGETVDWVFEFTENGTSIGFLQFTGFYGSYTGTEWDETITEVFSRKVEVIQYFPTP